MVIWRERRLPGYWFMTRCIVNVATGAYVRGQHRLAMNPHVIDTPVMLFADQMPPGSPSHHAVPYAFKPWAMKAAADMGATVLLWADACILPVRSLEPLWEKIERDGAWISRNGWSNHQWTAESAYADLGITPEENREIPHVVATTFGLNLEHPTGRAIFDEYLRLAQTNAFKGPWWNRNNPEYRTRAGAAPCGPPDVLGHRHDQTVLSVLAHRYGVQLTNPPEYFAYAAGVTDDTILSADARY